MSGDPDPGHAMQPVPEGWVRVSRPGVGIVLPWFQRKDGVTVLYDASKGAWAVFSGHRTPSGGFHPGERLDDFGLAHTPGAMIQQVDHLRPLAAVRAADASIPRGVGSSDDQEFDALFRGMLAQKLIVVRFRGGQMAVELTDKGLAAWSILECVKGGT